MSKPKILAFEKLVYTWSWESPGMDVGETLVTVGFIDKGGRSLSASA
jgi:hypothetical protein